MTHSEYMAFFEKWLNYQFSRIEDEINNKKILKTVAQIVAEDSDLQYWSNRDNWSTYDHANQLGAK